MKLIRTQDTKFSIIIEPTPGDDIADSTIARLVSQDGKPIPADEPLFIIRGRDILAIQTLRDYRAHAIGIGADAEHIVAVEGRIREFDRFKNTYPECMKKPDTDIMKLNKPVI